MHQVFTRDLRICKIRANFRAARFGGRTRCPGCGYTRKFWRLEDGRWRCKRCRKRFGLLTDMPLARDRFSLPEIYELLHWFELDLTDHDISQRVELSYHRIHRFFLKFRRAIRDFEDNSIRLLDGEVEVDETCFAASFEHRRRAQRANFRKTGTVKRGRGAKELPRTPRSADHLDDSRLPVSPQHETL